MLIISRKVEEEIIIAGNIVIKVIKIRKNNVRIGIEAPDNVTILRKELVDGSR